MDSPRALDRLFEVARSGEDGELRQQAIHWLGQKAGERNLDALADIANSSDADTDVQVQVVHAISQRPAAEAVPLLIQTRAHAPQPRSTPHGHSSTLADRRPARA